MNSLKMIYDIRNSTNAQQTLVSLTGVPLSIWEQYVGREREFEYTDDLIEYVVSSYGKLPQNYRDFNFVYFHITTSANGCASFRKHGIMDLPHTYLCPDSELRVFLEKHHIYIDLQHEILRHGEKIFDIHYGPCPRRDTVEYYCWSVGRKFYYDFTTCGFLSIWDMHPYGGQVHRRPEILMDIDDLLRTKLSQEWANTHIAYEVVAQIKGSNIVYQGDDNSAEKDKVLSYLTSAYYVAFGSSSENILLVKNNVHIPPADILEIKRLEYWN